MSGEGQGFSPEDVIQQGGPNKGNMAAEYIAGTVIETAPDSTQEVGDEVQVVDGLPRLGAEAEQDYRTSIVSYVDRFLAGFSGPDAFSRGADSEGEIAIEEELKDRAIASDEYKKLSPAAQDKFPDLVVERFREKKEALTDARVDEELKNAL